MKEPEIIASKRQVMDTSGSFPEGVTVVALKWEPSDAELESLRAQGYHEFEWATGGNAPSGAFYVTAVHNTPMSSATAWRIVGVILILISMCLLGGWAFSLIAGKL